MRGPSPVFVFEAVAGEVERVAVAVGRHFEVHGWWKRKWHAAMGIVWRNSAFFERNAEFAGHLCPGAVCEMDGEVVVRQRVTAAVGFWGRRAVRRKRPFF